MRIRSLPIWSFFAAVLLIGVAVGVAGSSLFGPGSGGTVSAQSIAQVPGEGDGTAGATAAQPLPNTTLVTSYAAKFVCLEPLPAGVVSFRPDPPIVKLSTEVLVHNPNAFAVVTYKKAVRAPLEGTPEVQPGKWVSLTIRSDHAWRIDCDDIAKLLTGNPAATFIGEFGIGIKVEGFVVIGIGPQTVPGGTIRSAPLDVTAEYARSSEVLKKDINYQPWWWWWWWPLPWRLGYAYERFVTIDPAQNIDCRNLLYNALLMDAQQIADTQQRVLTLAALRNGANTDPTMPIDPDAPAALVALTGGCHKHSPTQASVDYVLVSTKGCTDPDPRTPGVPGQCPGNLSAIRYPWRPGRWHDLTVVIPQNREIDLDDYIRGWHVQRWADAGGNPVAVRAAMVYYFPWWCGWGYWWWWWHGGDCTDIGVGEGESLDVEQITPSRVFMLWPPP